MLILLKSIPDDDKIYARVESVESRTMARKCFGCLLEMVLDLALKLSMGKRGIPWHVGHGNLNIASVE